MSDGECEESSKTLLRSGIGDCSSYGPKPDVEYPLKVVYCGECTMPPEYCEYGTHPDKCKAWLEKHLPDLFQELNPSEDKEGTTAEGEEKKRQKRGGKSASKPQKKAASQQYIKLSRAPRGKNKFVTVVTGLSTFDIDMKTASKFFAQRFACGSSVTGADEVVIQGDVKDDLLDILSEKWSQIDEDLIEDLGDMKR